MDKVVRFVRAKEYYEISVLASWLALNLSISFAIMETSLHLMHSRVNKLVDMSFHDGFYIECFRESVHFSDSVHTFNEMKIHFVPEHG